MDHLIESLRNRVEKNLRRLAPWARQAGIGCYRIYDRDMPELPLAIDLYEKSLHIAVYHRAGAPDVIDQVEALIHPIAAMLDIPRDQVAIKIRQRQKGGAQYEKLSSKGMRRVVREHRYKFIVNLSDYLDTGLFLDHRRTRKRVGDAAQGSHFLNLFAYTGAFSVYAAGGGAATTTSVDLSPSYLRWAAENMALNGFNGREHRFICADVFGFLTARTGHRSKYDLVVVDAPTVSRSKKMRAKFEIQRDHAALLNKTISLCRNGAVIYFSTNYRKFKLLGEQIHGVVVEDISPKTLPYDFRDNKVHHCYRIIKC
ncbi:MAG: class I SAM-dependent methyltransferase [Myxococcota bacterium]|nr:class I SAM-dependent methyltransferase [Myxococcota bacterium]